MKAKKISIEDELLPNNGQLIVDEENQNFTSVILDEEFDFVECTFNDDGCVQINTDGLTHIILSIKSLKNLIKLIKDSEKKYKEMPEGFFS